MNVWAFTSLRVCVLSTAIFLGKKHPNQINIQTTYITIHHNTIFNLWYCYSQSRVIVYSLFFCWWGRHHSKTKHTVLSHSSRLVRGPSWSGERIRTLGSLIFISMSLSACCCHLGHRNGGMYWILNRLTTVHCTSLDVCVSAKERMSFGWITQHQLFAPGTHTDRSYSESSIGTYW